MRLWFLFNSIQCYLYSAFNKGALSQSCFTENRPQWVSLGQQWQGKTPWQITGRNLEQNQTQRGTICRWLAPVLVQCFESDLSPVMLGWVDSGRMRFLSVCFWPLVFHRGKLLSLMHPEAFGPCSVAWSLIDCFHSSTDSAIKRTDLYYWDHCTLEVFLCNQTMVQGASVVQK